MDGALIHKIAVLCKDYYVIRTIDDLFIFAGADHAWWTSPSKEFGSSRISEVYGWIEGIEEHAPEQLERIIIGVAIQIADNERILEGDRRFIKRRLNFGAVENLPAFGVSEQPLKFPKDVEQLLECLIKGLPRAMFPLKYRRKGLPSLEFDNEYDVQSLFHSLMRPWIRDIRVEEYTPSYAGSSTRIDFLCAEYNTVIEIKYVRDTRHARRIGDELVIDIAHYSTHPKCDQLWIVIFDPNGLIPNSDGLVADLNGEHVSKSGSVMVKTFVLSL